MKPLVPLASFLVFLPGSDPCILPVCNLPPHRSMTNKTVHFRYTRMQNLGRTAHFQRDKGNSFELSVREKLQRFTGYNTPPGGGVSEPKRRGERVEYGVTKPDIKFYMNRRGRCNLTSKARESTGGGAGGYALAGCYILSCMVITTTAGGFKG